MVRMGRFVGVAVVGAMMMAGSQAVSDAGSGLDLPTVVAGTVAVLPRGARMVGAPPAWAPIDAVVYLKPRNRALLEQVAMRTSGRRPLSLSRIQTMFLPTRAAVARVRAYLQSQGLTVVGGGDLSVRVRGSVASADRAFGVSLKLYRQPNGSVFRAPASALSLPSSVAARVQAVGGLQTNLQLRPMTNGVVPSATPPTATCTPAVAAQGFYGGYLPQDFENAYGYRSLQQQAYVGTGETIGVVELSAFASTDITAYQSCVTGITSPFPTTVPVDGGTASLAGRVEAALDIEIVQSTAPNATVQVYEAPNNLGFLPDMITSMVNHHVTVASDSWGLCERLAGPALLEAENTALQVAAASGLSFFAASGDSGASDCLPSDGSLGLAVDDPASQPFATGVGGTTLKAGSGRVKSHTAWGGSGGGVSIMWTQPAYQAGVAQPVASDHCTSSTSVPCREVPDVAMDANPTTGYIVYCGGCFGKTTGWAPVGGTSGAAPLAAGITALANDYSLHNPTLTGQRMGFANPFLYNSTTRTDQNSIWDVTAGSNNIGGGGYTAGTGYDMVTGLGSFGTRFINTDLGTTLANYTPTPVSTVPTQITITSAPPTGTIVAYPHTVTISGHLADNASNAIPNVPVHVESSYLSYRTTTASTGNWSLTFAPTRNSTWHAIYTGSDVYSGASTPAVNILYVRPSLVAGTNLTFSGGRYHATTDKPFTITGKSSPNMYGAAVTLQYRVVGYPTWHPVKTVTVSRTGTYSTTSVMPTRRASRYYHWTYTTHPGYRWASAISPSILITAY